MLLDVEFFKSNLGTIEGFGDVGDYLTAIVKAKHVEIVALKEVQDEREVTR